MFQEQIAKITSDHLRSHIEAYLLQISSEFDGQDSVVLTVPKDISPTSVVGGLMTEWDNILPQYGVDVLSKILGEDIEGLFTYNYLGQINGLVGATSSESVDKLCSRHARAVEHFIHQHLNMHENYHDDPVVDPGFTILAMAFGGVEFSGAENLGMVNDREVWVAGFSCDVIWSTSEEGPGQH